MGAGAGRCTVLPLGGNVVTQWLQGTWEGGVLLGQIRPNGAEG